MTRRFRFALTAALAGAFAWFALPGFADSQARIVRLSYLGGGVQIDRQTDQGLEKAILNMPITQGTVLRSGGDGRAEVEFENGSTVRLVPDTEVTFEQLSLRSSGAKVSDVVVNRGTAYFHVRHKGDDDFRVAFGNRNVTLRHDAEFRVAVGNSEAKLAVFKGTVNLAGVGEDVAVKKGETLTLDLTDAAYVVARNIQPAAYDAWSSNRNQYQEHYSDSSYFNGYPYYGRGDLSYYGNYWYMPGYGNLWQPYNVGYGWDPFMNGAWSWYPGFGYTWVSSYPWGWLPYRYGSWVFVPGWGWGWMPGNYWSNWVGVPTVVNPPPNYIRPTPPPHDRPHHPTVVITNPDRPGTGHVPAGPGTISSTQPTPLPAHPRGPITPAGTRTGADAKSGAVTPPPAPPTRIPSTQGPGTQSAPAPPSHGPAMNAPRQGPAEHSVPRNAPPQSFNRPSAPPQSGTRPSAPAPVMSSPGVSHSYSSGGESHGGRAPR